MPAGQSEETGASENIVTPRMLAFHRGVRLFRQGRPCPYENWHDLDVDSIAFAEVMGWKSGEFRDFFKRRRVMEILGVSDD